MKNLLTIAAVFLMLNVAAQTQYPDTTREFRGVWVATTKMIDYPKARNMTAQQLQKNYTDLLAVWKAAGYNAVIFQVRPAADAFYKSDYEPWSEWLTGKQGRAPSPYYDPLEFMVEKTHAQNMEFHAWFNPFRAVATIQYADVCASHISKTKPEWFFTYGGSKYFNPGLPEVRDYLVKIIVDVVKRYDIDGVHFDDYFYPYPVSAGNGKFEEIPDGTAFRQYPNGFSDIKDWRRNNVNIFVEQVNKAIKAVKPWVQFGIGPAGVWRNKQQDPDGSDTKSLSGYDYLYADVLAWLKGGWIDYAAPQIYWNINHKTNKFESVVQWWNNHSYGRNIYIGIGAYNQEKPADGWGDPNEVANQIKICRKFPNVQGVVVYRSTTLVQNPLKMVDVVKKQCFNNYCMMPKMPWLDNRPQNIDLEVIKRQNEFLVMWNKDNGKKLPEAEATVFYSVFRVKGKHPDFVPSSENFVKNISESNLKLFRKKRFVLFGGNFYTYKIVAYNRNHAESQPSEPIIIKYGKKDAVE